MSAPAVAIVGAGCSGTLLAVQLLRQARGRVRVLLFDGSGRFGPGLAYGSRAEEHLLNVPAGRMGAFPDDLDHFRRWASARGQMLEPYAFAPRPLFGAYLTALLEEAESAAGAGALRRYAEDVVAAEESGGDVVLTTASGTRHRAGSLVLATGNTRPSLPAELGEVAFDGRVVHDPWDEGRLARVPAHARVVVVGTGLTMIDAVLLLDRLGHTAPILAISRRGLTPTPHPPEPVVPFAWPAAPRGSLREIVRQVRAVALEHGALAAVDGLRPHTQDVWRRLSPDDRARFARHVRARWDVLRHRVPPLQAERIDALRRAGRLEIAAARITAVQAGPDGLALRLRPRDAPNGTTPRVAVADVLINATGPAESLLAAGGLPVRLCEAGLAAPHPFGMGLLVAEDGALLDPGGRRSSRLFALGPALRGLLWETTAVPEIRVQAERLASRLIAGLS